MLAVLPGTVLAQAKDCTTPASIARPLADGPSSDQPVRVLPIGSYTLAISWSPEYCRTRTGDTRDAVQCSASAKGKERFGFTLHGLWPDGYGKTWPQYCKPATLLPVPVLRKNLCATPSVNLLQHEWAKHGTCMTTRPDAYFDRATALYAKISYPDMDALSRQPSLTVKQFAEAFAAVNPGVAPGMFRITTTRRGWLDEIWLCLDRKFAHVRCPAHQGGAPITGSLKIWRGR